METDYERREEHTYVEPSAGSAGTSHEGLPASSPAAAYRARHAGLHAAGRFERLVREGGMGAVLEVRGTVLDLGRGRFAVKLIKERLLGEPEVAARFRRELASHRRLSASFQVPRLVPCLAFAEDDDPALVFGVFPFYPDGTLEEALDHGLPVAEALWILADAVEGLQSLHGLGYVHRDFHPSNVLVDREGGRRRGVLGDLGVGIFLQSNTIFTETQLGADRRRQVGHRGYIDPFYRASPQADLYAVGATLYRIFAGRAPAGGRFPEAAALTLPGGLPALAEVRGAAAALLARMTAPDEGDRYPSVREARVDLVALAELVERRQSEPVAAAVVPIGPRRPVVRRLGRRRLRWLAAVTALVVSSSAYGVLTWRAEDPPAQEVPHPSPLPQREREPEPPPSQVPPPSSLREKEPEPPPPFRNPLPPRVRQRREAVLAPSPVAGEGRGEGLRAPATDVLRIDPLIRNRRPRQAEALARELWARYPADPEVAGRLALILQIEHGEDGVREARTVLAAALDRHPGRGDLRLALARVLLQLEPLAAAERLLAAAPPGGSHGDEIEALRVTMARRGDQSK
jgi:serine/threonine protein kinase